MSISKYQEEYDQLIAFAKGQPRVKLKRNDPGYVYYENHHIVPECFYKNRLRKGSSGWLDGDSEDPDNKVLLTPEEHFDAHQLLSLIYPTHCGMSAATIMMSNKHTIKREEFGDIRRNNTENLSINAKGDKNPMFGRSAVRDLNLKWYNNGASNIYVIEGTQPINFVKGRIIDYKQPHSKETKAKISVSASRSLIDRVGPANAQKMSEGAKARFSGRSYEEMYGKEKADEMKQQRRERILGKNNPMYKSKNDL